MPAGDKKSQLHAFVHELKRREVFQTAGLYAVGAFLLTEITLAFIDRSPFSASTKALAACVLVSVFIGGFPIVLWLAWLFDLTRHGIIREKAWARGRSVTATSAMAAVIVATGLLVWTLNPCGFGRVLGIAVLPCGYNGAPEYDYQAHGISAELNYRLSHLPQLHVPANASVAHFSDRLEDPGELAQALGVERLVGCNLRRNDSRVVFNLRLYSPDDEDDLWADKFGGQATDELFLIADAFHGLTGIDAVNVAALAGARIEEVNGMPTASHNAWSLYQRARHAELGDDPGPALALYRRAAIIDPEFMRAHSSAARLLWLASETAPMLDAARAHTQRALQESRPSAEARFMQRLLIDSSENPDSLHAEIISQRPSYAEEYLYWSTWLAQNGRSTEAETALTKARALDPSGNLERRRERAQQR